MFTGVRAASFLRRLRAALPLVLLTSCWVTMVRDVRVARALAATHAVEEFYRGKVVTIVVGYAAGGGYDLYARVLARHLGSHIPGNPTVIVQNMPGAGSLLAATWLYNRAPKDGTVMATFDQALSILHVTDLLPVPFDIRKFNWIGSMYAEPGLCLVRRETGIRALEELTKKRVRFGTLGPTNSTSLHAAFLNGLLSTRIELVSGYQGSSDLDLAIERGDVDGRCYHTLDSILARNPNWVFGRPPLVNILVQAPFKHDQLPDVPNVLDYARSERERAIMEIFFAPQYMARPFALPPDVPAERVEVLRQAFMEALRDPALLEDVQRANIRVGGVRGAEVQAIVNRILGAPSEYIQAIRSYVRRGERGG